MKVTEIIYSQFSFSNHQSSLQESIELFGTPTAEKGVVHGVGKGSDKIKRKGIL
jgi:formate-dependent phosphoribosylglycinamide formyltransferase (GAR transformylase)